MNPTRYFTFFFALALVAGGLSMPRDLHAEEMEPNDTCATAQVLTVDTLPFELAAELGSDIPDVDFFVVSAPAGELVQFDLQGATTGVGTLGDPFLGLFDVDCNVINTDDDSGEGVNSRLVIAMPPNGTLIVGATQFPDVNFTSGGFGSYLLSIAQLQLIGSISVQLVDGETFSPLAGDSEPYANASLIRCMPFGCNDFVASAQADSAGQVRFERDYFGNLLTTGDYLIQAGANGYNVGAAGPFTVGEDEAFDAGQLALEPLSFIGTVSGRLVDAMTGEPLSGAGDPFAGVLIERCIDPTFCFTAAFVFADEAGRFLADGRNFGLPPGDYRITTQADNYLPATTAVATIGNRENADFGDIEVAPVPVRLTNVTPCELPPGGGTCRFGAKVVNVGPGHFRGNAWASIEYYGPTNFTRFQVGRQGARNPMPIAVNLPAGRSSAVRFELTMPRSLPDGAFACGTIWLGEAPAPEFNLTAQQFAFCVSKTSDGLTPMSPHTGRKMLREQRGEAPNRFERRSMPRR